MQIKQVSSSTITHHLNPLMCHVTLGYSQHKGKGVRQGEGGVCPCVSTMPHAINDRTPIMSVCSLMAFCGMPCRMRGGGSMWNTEINRKNRLCNTQGVKKKSPWSLKENGG